MGIEDIQISEELETNAPSIKYSGNEGPKSPQQMQDMVMAELEEEYARYVFEMQEQGIQPMSMQQFMEQAMAEGQMSGGTPLPNDPTKPVNPFQPKPTGPVLPDRQMAAYGGIMGMDGRRQYGLGSKFKKFVRKVIPNEIADIAVKAAPFVAPFNPIAAGLMSGIGGFDQTGKIGSSLKSGLMSYGMGQGARYLGGADFQGGFDPRGGFTKGTTMGDGFGKYFSKPTGDGGIKNLFADRTAPTVAGSGSNDLTSLTTAGSEAPVTLEQMTDFNKIPVKNLGKTGSILKTIKDFALDNKLLTGLAAGTLGMTALMGNMEEDEIQDMQRGEGLDIEGIRAEVREAMADDTGQKLKALRSKYPFLGRRDTKDIANMAMGGRIGYQEAGPVIDKDTQTMILDMSNRGMDIETISTITQQDAATINAILSAQNQKAEGGLMDLGGMEKDYRAEGGFVPIGAKEKADDVPARLSVNEFVFTADAVRNAGGGDIDKGAEIMENMMKNLEAGGQVSEESQGMQGAQQMFETSERLSEVM